MDTSTHRALLVGVDRYPLWGDLKGAESDVDDVEQWLKATGVPNPQIRVLRTRDYTFTSARDARPTFLDVADWVAALRDEAEEKGGDFPLGERVTVLFAGHGINHRDHQQLGLLPRSGPRYSDAIPLLPLRNFLVTGAFFREVVFVADSCRDQVSFAQEAFWPFQGETHPNSASVRTFEAYAAEAGQKALEREFAPGKWGGVFTQALLRGLSGYAADEAGNVWAHRLKGYLHAAVRERLGPGYDPKIAHPPEQFEPMLLARAPARHPTLRVLPSRPRKHPLSVELTSGADTQRLEIPPEGRSFSVPPGLYTLTAPDGRVRHLTLAWEETVVHV